MPLPTIARTQLSLSSDLQERAHAWRRGLQTLAFASSPIPAFPNVQWRPAMAVLLTAISIPMAVLGFHPTVGSNLPAHSDKVLHFVTFAIATHLFYWIWTVKDETLRRIWHWRHLPRIATLAVCFSGAVMSEIVQSLLPYKSFDFGDIFANLLGAVLGLYLAEQLDNHFRQQEELSRLYLPLDEEQFLDAELGRPHVIGHGGLDANTYGGVHSTASPFTLEDSESEDDSNINVIRRQAERQFGT